MPNENAIAVARNGPNDPQNANNPLAIRPNGNAAAAGPDLNVAIARPEPNNPQVAQLWTAFASLVAILVCRVAIKRSQFGVALDFLIIRNLALFVLTNVLHLSGLTEYALPIEVIAALVGADFAVFSSVYLDGPN